MNKHIAVKGTYNDGGEGDSIGFNPHSHRLRTIALDPMEFIRRFLQHVLPTGFMRIRYYGFMNPNCLVPFDKISTLLKEEDGVVFHLDDAVNVIIPDSCTLRINLRCLGYH